MWAAPSPGRGPETEKVRGKGESVQKSSVISPCFLIVTWHGQLPHTSPGMPSPLWWAAPSNHEPEEFLPLFHCFWLVHNNEECNWYPLPAVPPRKHPWNLYVRRLWECLSYLNVFAYFLACAMSMTSTTQYSLASFPESWDVVSWIQSLT